MASSAVNPAKSRARIHVLDFIRLVALLLMIQGHTLDAFMDPGQLDWSSGRWTLWLHLRGLTAPLFLMVSGAATVLGVRYDPDGRVARAVLHRRMWTAFKVIGIGYLLVFPASRLADLPWLSPEVWQGFFRVNILQLNGVALLVLTGILALVRTRRRYALAGVVMGLSTLFLAPFVYAVDWYRWLPEGLGAYLSFNHGSLFPFFPAAAYMGFGVGLGGLLMEAAPESRARVFRVTCLWAAVAALGLAALLARCGWGGWLPTHDAYKAGHIYALFRLGFALLIFGMLGWLDELRESWVVRGAAYGRQSLFIYVAHLVLIYGLPWTGGLAAARYHSMVPAHAVLYIPLVVGVSFGAMMLWNRIQKSPLHLGRMVQASAVCALLYAVIF
nr:heparan-alpha-glucosaminide N-acetyltransferase domain-containing protein [uncultured Holophaga sp.]